jgi:hypothetical protein
MDSILFIYLENESGGEGRNRILLGYFRNLPKKGLGHFRKMLHFLILPRNRIMTQLLQVLDRTQNVFYLTKTE